MKKNLNIREYVYSLMSDKRNDFTASILKPFLFILSLLYGLSLETISLLRGKGILPTAHLGVRVISIGNLTLGGTGKTPLVEFVARILNEKGKKTAILTRGYKIAQEKAGKALMPGPLLFEEIGDEPALLRLKLPQVNVLVGPDRVKTGRLAIYKYGADVLVLDDGFQYWRLSRDIDILAIDATNPFGNGRLLPRGILREPIETMVRADIIVITKADSAAPEELESLKTKIKAVNPDVFIVSSVHKPVRISEFAGYEKLQADLIENVQLPLESIKGKAIVVLCGIGNPDYFVKTLEGLGANVKAKVIFQDHHPYSFADLERISKECREASTKTVVTTEKDMIKLKPLVQRHAIAFESLQFKLLALDVRLEILQNEDKFIERIL